MKPEFGSIFNHTLKYYRGYSLATFFSKVLPLPVLFMIEATIFFTGTVLPLRGLYLYAAFPSTMLGSWLLIPSHILFPGKELIWPIHYQYARPTAAVSTAWRETGLLFACFLILFALYLLAVRLLYYSVKLSFIVLMTVLFGLTCVLYPALPSQDIFSYITYARIGIIYHLNPLTTLPIAIHSDIIYPYIFWIHEPSAYGPTWIAITCGFQWLLTVFHIKSLFPMVLLLRLFGLAMHLGSVLLIWRLTAVLQEMTGTISLERRRMVTLAFAWNPLLLLEACVNAHNDTAILFLVLLAICCLLPRSQEKGPSYLLAALCLALAACLKVSLVVLFSGLLLFLWVQRDRYRAVTGCLLVYGGLIALLYLPFWQQGMVLHVFQVNPGMTRVVNSPHEFLMYAYASIRGRKVPPDVPEMGTRFERWMHYIGNAIFVMLYALLCVRALLNRQHINALPALIRWWAITWFLYCLIASPWLWPWYFTTFFGLFALVEATREYPRSISSILNLPLAVYLFAFALLNVYTLDTWAPHVTHVKGLQYFPWAFTRGLWLCLLPLLALRPSAIKRIFLNKAKLLYPGD